MKELTKRYGAHTAVDALSFTVDKGQIYGLLGPNGAGKSTTMNIITGYISATDGTAEIDGCDIFDSPAEARAKIGYLPEQPPLYTDMTPREYLAFAAELKGLPREQRKAAVEQCMERTNIADVADRLIRNLSKGYRQRVGLACALLGDPPVIILDEPTVGLDPKQIIEIRELIRSLGQEHTVLLSSHILSEVNAVCDKVLIMSHGKLVACDTPENLTAHAAGHAALRITVLGTQEAVQAALSPLLEQGAQAVEFVPCEEENAVTARIVCSGGADLRAPAGIALAGAGWPCCAWTPKQQAWRMFLELTGDEPEAGEEETSGRADEDEDGTAAQAALKWRATHRKRLRPEESTAHAHQPENGGEERK
ncbi:MAG: ABC transporter ATP-binding protein [Ruthenibacterium lactatiformans]